MQISFCLVFIIFFVKIEALTTNGTSLPDQNQWVLPNNLEPILQIPLQDILQVANFSSPSSQNSSNVLSDIKQTIQWLNQTGSTFLHSGLLTNNVTEKFIGSIDKSIKSLIVVVDKVLVNITTQFAESILDGMLIDCVDPITKSIKTLANGLNSALHTCIMKEVNQNRESISHITEIIDSTRILLERTYKTIDECLHQDSKCTDQIAEMIINALYLFSEIPSRISAMNSFPTVGEILDNVLTCLPSQSEAHFYRSLMIFVEVFSCAA